MAIGLGVGLAEGYIEADRVVNGKPAAFQVGGDPKDSKNPPKNITVGEIAGAGGAALALSTKSRKTARVASAVGTAGAALSGKRWAYDYRTNKGKK